MPFLNFSGAKCRNSYDRSALRNTSFSPVPIPLPKGSISKNAKWILLLRVIWLKTAVIKKNQINLKYTKMG